MTLRSLIESDAVTVFCNADDFAEPVTYYPRGGGNRSIIAVVIRDNQGTIDEQNTTTLYEVHVANSATSGISSVELNRGGDAIAFPPRDGQPAKKFTIQDIISQDNGMLVLQCL